MSLLLPNQLSVLLHPKQVAVMQLAALRRRVIHQQCVDVTQSTAIAWENAVKQLEQMLSSKQFESNRLQVTLSSDFVRYLVLPPHASVQRVNDKVAFARAAFQENHGAVVNEWQVIVDDARPDLLSIAAAVDRTLLTKLAQVAQDRQLKLSSVQPYFMTAYNRIKSRIAYEAFYFVLIEQSRFIFAALSGQGWTQIRNLPIEDNWALQLQQILEREALSAVHAIPKQVMLYAPDQHQVPLPKVAGWAISHVAAPHVRSKQVNSRAIAMLEAA